MWTGVIDITATITACATRIPTSAATARGYRPRVASAARSGTCGRGPVVPPPSVRAVSSGSGRSPTHSTSIAATMPTAENTNTAASSGRPVRRDVGSPSRTRFGPVTAPTVDVHTTSDRSRARVPAVDRSVAANRACRFTALPTPMSAAPTSSSANTCTTAATTTTTAPTDASASPADSDARRPRASARRASHSADRAAPSVAAVVTDPAHASDPDSSTAMSDPTDTTEPAATPLSTCASASSPTVRRRRCAGASGSAGGAGVSGRGATGTASAGGGGVGSVLTSGA